MILHICAMGILLPSALAGAQNAGKQSLFQSSSRGATPAEPAAQKFDPHDLAGTWRGEPAPPGTVSVAGSTTRNFASYDQKIPEPPLTDWAKQHLLYKSISHDALDGPHAPGWNLPGHLCYITHTPCFAADPNGVPVNDPDGEYPGKDCEPLSTPAMYDYPGIGSMEIIPTPEGDRIFQLFEYHREWRTWWLNRDHPNEVDPTYEGDSTAHWEGNTLIVDTIGYNGKTMVSQNVGHRKSDAFHLVERFERVNHDHLVIDMTYRDLKAWGDQAWPGFHKYYSLVPKRDFQEFICSPREYQEYNSRITNRIESPPSP
ncbi:MAG: hypothetical protein ABSA57_20905 [Candidatus Acidiferrales bacterium]|jgi:hypothetical protein